MTDFSEFLLNSLKKNLEIDDLILFSQSKNGSQFSPIKEEDINNLPVDPQLEYARRWAENLKNPSSTSDKWEETLDRSRRTSPSNKFKTLAPRTYDESWCNLAQKYNTSIKDNKSVNDKETTVIKDPGKVQKKKRIKVRVKKQKIPDEKTHQLKNKSLVTCPEKQSIKTEMPVSNSLIHQGSTEEHYDELQEIRPTIKLSKRFSKPKKSIQKTKKCNNGFFKAFKAFFKRNNKKVESHKRIKPLKSKTKVQKNPSRIKQKTSTQIISSSLNTSRRNSNIEKNYDNSAPLKMPSKSSSNNTRESISSSELTTKQGDLIKNLFSYLNNYDGNGVTIKVTAKNKPTSIEKNSNPQVTRKEESSRIVPFYLKCCFEVKPSRHALSENGSIKIRTEDKATQSYVEIPNKIEFSVKESPKARLSCKSLKIESNQKSEKSSFQSFKTAKAEISETIESRKEPTIELIKLEEPIENKEKTNDNPRRKHRRKKEKHKVQENKKIHDNSSESDKQIEMFYFTTSENQPRKSLWNTVKKFCSKPEQLITNQTETTNEDQHEISSLKQKSSCSLINGPHRYSHQNVFKTLLKSKAKIEVTENIQQKSDENQVNSDEKRPKKRLEQLISELSTPQAIQELRTRYDESNSIEKPKTIKTNNPDKVEFLNHMKELANVLANKYGTIADSSSILEASSNIAFKKQKQNKRRKSTRIGWRPAIGKQPRSSRQLLKEISLFARQQDNNDSNEFQENSNL